MLKVKGRELGELFTTSDAINKEDFVTVRYKIIPGDGLELDETAALLAINTSLGTIKALRYEEHALRMAASAKVLFTGMKDDYGYIEIAYPINLCEPSTGITHLLSVIWYSAEYNFTKEYWIENIDFPRSFIRHFKGPRFGIEGIRQLLGIKSRPILGAIVKPRGGASFNSIVNACYECLIGGFDYIVDDELIVDPKGDLSFENRVQRLVEVAKEASAKTGEKKWYIANINSSPKKALNYAKKAREMGVNGLLVNAFTLGFAAVEDLTTDTEVDLPIITSNMGIAALTRPSQNIGTSEVTISKLSRIVGVDGAYSGIIGAAWYSDDIFRASLAALRKPFFDLPQTFPIVAGGLNIANIGENLIFQGNDVMFQIGTGVMGYPSGPRNGAFAYRTLVENLEPDLSLEDMERKLVALGKKYSPLKEGLIAYGFKPKTKI